MITRHRVLAAEADDDAAQVGRLARERGYWLVTWVPVDDHLWHPRPGYL